MKPAVKFSLLIVLLIVVIVGVGHTPLGEWIHSGRLKELARPLRDQWWGPLVFISIFILGSVKALPAAGFSVLGGVLYGMFPGLFYNLIAVNLGSSLAFAVSRYLGRDFVKKLLRGDKMHAFESGLEEHGFKVMIALRILPLLPYNVVNYGSALFRIRYRDYFWGSLIGMIPATVVFTYFADAIAMGNRHPVREISVIAALIGVMIGAYFLLPKKKRP